MSSNKHQHNRFSDKNVVITGGSSGIGFAIAKEFARQGSRLFLIARNPERLQSAADKLKKEFHGVAVEVFSGDVSDSNRMQAIMQEIGESFGGIHVLIANAGITAHGTFDDIELEELKQVMDVNYFGVVCCLKAALPWLKQQQDAQVGIVASVASYIGFFGYTAYAPSKFALLGLAECLRMELEMPVTVVYPPDTETPMLEKEQQFNPPETKAITQGAKVIQPEQVAAALMKGMLKKKFQIYCNFESRLIHFLRGLLPGILFGQLDGAVKKARRKLRKSS